MGEYGLSDDLINLVFILPGDGVSPFGVELLPGVDRDFDFSHQKSLDVSGFFASLASRLNGCP
jgi:hypothetical protein